MSLDSVQKNDEFREHSTNIGVFLQMRLGGSDVRKEAITLLAEALDLNLDADHFVFGNWLVQVAASGPQQMRISLIDKGGVRCERDLNNQHHVLNFLKKFFNNSVYRDAKIAEYGVR
jgi:hypothetical protein